MARRKRGGSRRRTRGARKQLRWKQILLLSGRKWYWKLLALVAFVSIIGVVYVDYIVRDKFEGKKWALPARVYARPLELYVGLPLTGQDLEFELRSLEYQFTSSLRQPGDVVNYGSRYQIYTRGFQFWDKREPARKITLSISHNTVAALTDQRGKSIAVVRLDPQQIGGIYPVHMEDRQLVRLQDVPPLLGEALIAVEDKDFLHHPGVSVKAVLRAAWANMRAHKIVQGGSTLTQQLVKNFYLSQSRSFSRKVLEAIMSVLLELHYSKAEILETYLNEVYLGQSGPRAIHGFALAAQHYFGRPLQDLKLSQLALMVGLVKGASYYNPWRYPQRAKKRRDLVLKLMVDNELISARQNTLAATDPLGVVKPNQRKLHAFPSFIDLVKRQLRQDYREEDLRSEGLRIFTTLSPSAQHRAEQALSKRVAALENGYSMEAESLQGAVVMTSVGDGEVLAAVGGREPQFAGFNRALDAQRPIGSLIKPAIYLTALQDPGQYTLVTKISDDPVSVVGPDGSLWQPRNFSLESHGEVLLNNALTFSYNQSAARLGMQLGVENVLKTVHKLGAEKDISAVPSVFLGAVELSPVDVALMYHTIAAEGVYSPLRAIRAVLAADGHQLKRYPLNVEQRFSDNTIHLLQYAMQSVMRKGTGRAAYRRIPQELALAGKTGTSDNQRDSWFAGFSGDHLTVVWLGRDDNGQTPLTGSTGALNVWTDIYAGLATRSLVFEQPPQVSYQWVDGTTGLLSGENCRGAEWLPFISGSEPQRRGQCEWIESPVFRWFKNIWN